MVVSRWNISVIAKFLPLVGYCSDEGLSSGLGRGYGGLLPCHLPACDTMFEVGHAVSPHSLSLDISAWGTESPHRVFMLLLRQLRGALINTDKVVSGSTFSSLQHLMGDPGQRSRGACRRCRL